MKAKEKSSSGGRNQNERKKHFAYELLFYLNKIVEDSIHKDFEHVLKDVQKVWSNCNDHDRHVIHEFVDQWDDNNEQPHFIGDRAHFHRVVNADLETVDQKGDFFHQLTYDACAILREALLTEYADEYQEVAESDIYE